MQVKFVNRSTELEFLTAQKAFLGKRNNVVLVCGESGVGKSKLTQRFIDQNSKGVPSIKVAIGQKELDGYEAGYYFTKLARAFHNASKTDTRINSLPNFLREGTTSAYPRNKIWKSIKSDLSKQIPFSETIGTIADLVLQEGDFDLGKFFQSTDSETLFALNDYVTEVTNTTSLIINIENFQGIDSRSLDLLTPIIKYGNNCLYLLEFTDNDKKGYTFSELTGLFEQEEINFTPLPVKPLDLEELKKIIEDEPIISWELFQRSYVNWDGSVRSLVDVLAKIKYGLLPLQSSFIDINNATRDHLLSLSKGELFLLSIIHVHNEPVQKSLLAKLITHKDTLQYVLDVQTILSNLENRALIKFLGDEISIAHDSISMQLIDIGDYPRFSLIGQRFWLYIYEDLLLADDVYSSRGWKLMKVLNFASLLNLDTKIYELLSEISNEALRSRDPEKMIFYVQNVRTNLIKHHLKYKERLLQIDYWLIELYYKIGKSISAWNILCELEDFSRKYSVIKAILLEQIGSHYEAIEFCNQELNKPDKPANYELALRLVRLVTNFDVGNIEATRSEFRDIYQNKRFSDLFEYGFLLRNGELVFSTRDSLPYYEKSVAHFEKYGAIRQLAFSRITYGVHLGLTGELKKARREFTKAQEELGNVISERHTLLNNFAVLLLFERNTGGETEMLLRQAMLTAASDFERITINISYLVLMDWRDNREEAENTISVILKILETPSFASKEIIRYAYFDIYNYYLRIGEDTKAIFFRNKIDELNIIETPIWKFWLHDIPISLEDEEYFLSTVDRAFSFLCNWNMEYDSSLMRYE